MQFTADEAYEAWKDGNGITVEPYAAQKIFAEHDVDETFEDFINEQCNGIPQDSYCAWTLLGWLGY